MDWNLAIEKNAQALTQIVAGLFVLMGWKGRQTQNRDQSSLSGRASLARKRGVGREPLVGRRTEGFVERRTQAGGEAETKQATEGGKIDQSPKLSSDLSTPSSSGLTRGSTDKPLASLPSVTVDLNNCSCVDSQVKPDYDDRGGKNLQDINIGPITHHHLISVLRTAEAALRRLIVLFVKVHGVKATAPKPRTRPMPDFSSFGPGAGNRPPTFNLFDPCKKMVFGFDADGDAPYTTPSSLGLSQGSNEHSAQTVYRNAASLQLNCEGLRTESWVDPWDKPKDDGICEQPLINPTALLRRLAALDHALNTLPQQAKRLVRIMEQRKEAQPGIKRIPPIRPGIPPGFRARGKHEVDDVLRECHGLMRDWEMAPP